ncbi:MAG: RodZ domain-containing protein [Pseudomonadota bacterium]
MRRLETEAEVDTEETDVFPLGDVLRGERATKGKSLSDVEKELRIKAAYIDAIESLDTSVFESAGFVSGYVRSYARYLGLDANDVFDRFCEEAAFEPPVRLENAQTLRRSEGGLSGAAFAGHSNLTREKWWERMTPAVVGSIAVLIALIGGIGYAGYSVLQEVQKVRLSPTAAAPEIAYDGPENLAPLTGETDVASAADQLGASDDISPLADIYRPQLLDAPIFVPRDGPISQIDPNADLSVDVAAIEADLTEDATPQITEVVPTGVEVFAAQEAWVSVTSPTLGTLFEQILAENTRYRVPAEAQDALLRSGNSGSVYLIVDGQAFGPVGTGTRVAKNVALDGTAIPTNFDETENPVGYDPDIIPVNLAQTGQ